MYLDVSGRKMSKRLVSNAFFRRLLLPSKELWMRNSKSARSLEQRKTNFESHAIKIFVRELRPDSLVIPSQKTIQSHPITIFFACIYDLFLIFFTAQMNFMKNWNTATGRFMILCMSTANSASLARAILSHLGAPPRGWEVIEGLNEAPSSWKLYNKSPQFPILCIYVYMWLYDIYCYHIIIIINNQENEKNYPAFKLLYETGCQPNWKGCGNSQDHEINPWSLVSRC